MFLFSLHKGRQTSKELKRNMNDGTIEFCEFSKNTFLTEFFRAAAADF